MSGEQLRDEVTRQIVEAATRTDSMADQLVTTIRAIAAAEESFCSRSSGRSFGGGIVLETIQGEPELTRARLDYLKSIAEFDKAQYALLKAVGRL